jgi:hypothetical protein
MMNKYVVGILSATLNTGYNINVVVKGKQKLIDSNDLYLLDNLGNKIRLDWSGFRVSVGYQLLCDGSAEELPPIARPKS